MDEIPAWIRRARQHWQYRGQVRPEFAETIVEGQESVWDYPRPPRVELDKRDVIVKWGEFTIAKTNRAFRVLETASPPTFYLPRDDVRLDLFSESPQGSFCEWKGQASYLSLILPQRQMLRNVAWSYEEPFPEFEQIAGALSFYPAHLECYVAGIRVEPQPGSIYGGWVTPEVFGPFKGEPGTEHW